MKTCSVCGHSNPDDRILCDSCSQSLRINNRDYSSQQDASQDNITNPYSFIIDAKNLRPLEAILMDFRSRSITEAQKLAYIRENNISIKEHPIFRMIMNDPSSDIYLTCSHKSHNTHEKKQECAINLAEKLAIKTLNHYLGLLERYCLWTDIQYPIYAMWICIEAPGHKACDVCRQREGLIVSSHQSTIRVLHPNCHCTLKSLTAGVLGDREIGNIYEYLNNINPSRANNFINNVKKSGWTLTPPSSNDGVKPVAASCCCVPVIILILISIGIFALLNVFAF